MTKSPVKPPTDRRSLRTRSALHLALIELITERGWDDVAVQDICQAANIGRSTFYLHYPNKEALLEGGLDGLQAELQRQARARSNSTHPAAGAPPGLQFALGLIEHAQEQRKLFRGLIGRRSGYVVQQRFREMVIRLIAAELPATTDGLPRAAVVRWLAGAFVELLSWWVEQRTPLPPAELASLFNQLSCSALQPQVALTNLTARRGHPSPAP